MPTITKSTLAIIHSHTDIGERGFSEYDKGKINWYDQWYPSVEWYVVDWEGNVYLFDRTEGEGCLVTF